MNHTRMQSLSSNLCLLLCFLLVFACLMSGCLLAVTSIVVPGFAITGQVISFEINGTVSSSAQSTRAGIILQIPVNTDVLRVYCSASSSDFFNEDPAITAGYTAEAGYYLYGASTDANGSTGGAPSGKCTVWLAIPDDVAPGTYALKVAVGGYDPTNTWIPQNPQHNGIPVMDFAQIGQNYVSNEITISAGVPDTISPADVNPSVNQSSTRFVIQITGYNEAAQGDVAKYRIYVSKSSFVDTSGSQLLDNTTDPGILGNNNNSVTFFSDIETGLFYFEVPPGIYPIYIDGLSINTQYYFAVTAVDLSGNESNPIVKSGVIEGGSISGRITDGSVGIQNVPVRAYNMASEPVALTFTDAEGNYLINIFSGDYKVKFSGCAVGYQNEWYYDQSTFSYADPLSVTSPYETAGIDAVLSEFSVSFGDVPSGHYAENYIKALYCEGVTTGCTQNPLNYCPSNYVTRAAMAAFIVRAKYGEDFSYNTYPYFTDVPNTNQFFKYIQKMRDEGITTGCTATQYCPQNNVTRAAMGAFMIRAKYGETFPYSTTPYFTDVPPANQFFKYIQKMKDDGITTGCNATQYCPSNNVTRAAMAAFLARAFLGME